MRRSLPQSLAAFPMLKLGRLRVTAFEACSTFTPVTACLLAESPKVTLYTEGFSRFVTSADCSDCYRLERQSPGGLRTHWKTVPLHGALQQSVRLPDLVATDSLLCLSRTH
jgi:hypothetical protein